jgi:hypothetical protein
MDIPPPPPPDGSDEINAVAKVLLEALSARMM